MVRRGVGMRRGGGRAVGWGAIASIGIAAAACATEPGAGGDDGLEAGGEAAETAHQAASVDGPSRLLVRDPARLVELEAKHGLAYGARLGAADALAGLVETELAAVAASDPAAGVGFGFGHRLFDRAWLRSSRARFELTGLVFRPDLAGAGTCGEVRLVYRLAYTTPTAFSRLPMTVLLAHDVPVPASGGCAAVARRWLGLTPTTSAASLARHVPAVESLVRVEVNLQAVRWPSTLRGQYRGERDGFGGHAEYLLRVYDVKPGGALAPGRLVDVPRDDASPEALVAWVSENLEGIDAGTARLPDALTATTATSVAPRGSVRAGNAPWRRLLGGAAARERLAALPLAGRGRIGSVDALLARLDGATCQGCHQARSLAGFHLLGDERDADERLNALAVGASPHLLAQKAYREASLRHLAGGGARPARPHVLASRGEHGAPCGLGDPGFAALACAEGLACVDLHGDELGTCLPKAAGPGDACAPAKLVSGDVDGRDDGSTSLPRRACVGDGAICNTNYDGFPDGMCLTGCGGVAPGARTGAPGAERVCGGVPFGAFNTCLFDERRPFRTCLETTSLPRLVKACDVDRPCRDDYVCARAKGAPAGEGACMPPYFLFQGRVDGHVL